MLTNLFSVFDPTSRALAPSGWVALLIPLLCLPPLFAAPPGRHLSTTKYLLGSLSSSMTPNLAKTGLSSIILILTFTLFIAAANSLGLLPYVFTPTSHISVTLVVALPMFLSFTLFDFLTKPTKKLAHLVPSGTPTYLVPFMVLIESVSLFIRPFTLAVRLAANMIAGHLLVTLASSSTFFLHSSIIATLPASLALFTLEGAVALIQAYVFAVLASLYMSEV